MNGYFAVQLDRSSCNVVKKRATFPNVVSDHITLAYKPTKRIYNKFIKLVGKNVGAAITQYRANNNIDAFWVKEMFLTDTDTKIKRANPGSDLKPPQPGGGKRKKSFCARMRGMKKKLTSKKTANDPNSRINKSLRKWKC